MSDVSDALAAIARHDIDPAPSAIVGLSDTEQQDLLALIAEHRLAGVAVRAFESGALDLGVAGATTLVASHDVAMAQTMRVELRLLDAAHALAGAGVEFRVLKGSALAHLVAVDPADREFRDVDLLVHSADLDVAVESLEAIGADRIQPRLSLDFDRRFAKSVTLRLSGIEIDVHRTLAPGPFGVWLRPGDLFVLPQPLLVAGRVLATLDRTDHLLHACYHVALGQSVPAFTNLRDVALLAAGDWDHGRFVETVELWRGRPVIARAVRLVERLLDHELPPELRSFTPQSGDAVLLAPYVGDGDRFPALALAMLRALPARDRAAFARAVALPAGTDPRQRVRDLWEGRPRG